MVQPIVIQLQELASNNDHDISNLLRKALMVATKLGLAEFREWILAELNGYAGASREILPDYRTIHGELRVQNPFHGLQPFLVPQQLHDTVTQVNVTESVASIQQLIEGSRTGHLVFYFSPEQERILMSMQNDFAPLRPLRVIGANKLTAILNTVRTRILEWSLSLEEEGILGHGLSFSASEKQAAMQSQNIRIENFQGILGNVEGSSVTQTNTQQIKASDFSSLARYLASQGVGEAEIRELELAVDSDPEPSHGKGFGPKVSAWVGKMVSLAASGGWEISVATAGGVLATALSKFYGLG
ncbi:hypothetical protein [Burkholderia multivorans]|uniref:AbiTii domain-containing protein n=1 Tax=Burkholderia multivorans TaxID=87883 RepID=A0AB37AVB5_9BURK|nr:hypothetical protein [Burkholderia multivorans]KVT45905.1 hypothetical protein WK52_13885 [Burkholderia multivorans]PRE47401.1 hypothetical protein C6P97_17340 [Burkholderia multivorans]PRE50100.1 hypothetical protein C6P99_12055 [Burkholderia multivorans]